MRIRIRFNKMMHQVSFQKPQQNRSQKTLERILLSSTQLIAKKSYDEVSIAELASHAQISVGGFYARFANKEALFNTLLAKLAEETQNGVQSALAKDWSTSSLHELLRHIVSSNAELYERYRGILTVVFLKSRLLERETLNNQTADRAQYNANLIVQLEQLIMHKSEEIVRNDRPAAIRTAIACMTAMLREAIVFQDTSFYAQPVNNSVIAEQISNLMYHHLAARITQ